MKLGMNHPMGPLALADLIGLDTCLAIMEVIYKGLGDSKYRPCPLLKKYVDAGYLGRKTKRDFINIKIFRLQIVDRRFKSEICYLREKWTSNSLQNKRYQKYGQGFYGEAYQAHCLPV